MSHWAHFTVRRFISVCVYLCFFCFILHSCCIIVSTVGWTWWDWSLIIRTYLPPVLWHCWLGHFTRKTRPRYDLQCVWWDIKPYSVNQYLSHTLPDCVNIWHTGLVWSPDAAELFDQIQDDRCSTNATYLKHRNSPAVCVILLKFGMCVHHAPRNGMTSCGLKLQCSAVAGFSSLYFEQLDVYISDAKKIYLKWSLMVEGY